MSQRKRNSEAIQQTKPIDYYKLLAVPRKAKLEEIRLQYRSMAWEHHPDRGGDAALMAQYTEAWSVLKNTTKRKQYDSLLTMFTKDCPQCKGMGTVARAKGFGSPAVPKPCNICAGTGRLE